MDQYHIKELLQKKVKKINKLGEEIMPDFDEDIIHHFRTETKKLRSFIRLLQYDKEQPHIKLTEKFKRLYHIAGIMRDAHLEQKELNNRGIELPEYFSHLHDIIERQKKNWEAHYAPKTLVRLEEKLTMHHFAPLKPEVLNGFFDKNFSAIKKAIEETLINDDHVHDIRKEIKDMMYNAKLAEKKWDAGYECIKQYPLAQLDVLANTIGNYNDERIRLERLNRFAETEMPPAEKETLLTLCNEEKKRLLSEKKKVLADIRQFVKGFAV